jgi:hypothetical protein
MAGSWMNCCASRTTLVLRWRRPLDSCSRACSSGAQTSYWRCPGRVSSSTWWQRTQASRQSLPAEFANLDAHNEGLSHQVNKLTRRLSEALGEEVFRAGGLGGPDDTEQLRRCLAELKQTTVTCASGSRSAPGSRSR